MRTCTSAISAVILLSSLAAHADETLFADRLTSDWGGARTRMAERGLTADLDWTNYYQGLMSGDGDKSWEYGGRADAYLNVDTEKSGLWSGGVIKFHAEYFSGDLAPNLGGVALPGNLGMRLPNPGDGDKVELTNLTLAQRFGDRTNLILGRINTVDLLASDPFFGGGGVTRFWNLAFAAPPNGLLPPVISGGILSYGAAPLTWTLMLFDPNDRTQDNGLDNLFDDGVNISLGAKLSGRIDGRTSSIALTGIHSPKDSIDLGTVLLPANLKTEEKSQSWHASVQLAHYLYEIPDRPGAGWGLFGKFGISDGNPNPYKAFFTGGIGGKGLVASRPDDSFGIGYFYYDFSDDLQNAFDSLAEFDNEQGLEVYYDLVVVSGVHLAVDLQYTDPATGANDNAFSGGLRLRFRL